MNVQFRNYLLDAEHPIADSDVCLYVLLPVFSAFQLFAQGCHEHPQRSDIVFPTAAPNLLRDIGVCQNLTNIFGEQAQQLVFDGCQVQLCAVKICAACRIVDFQRTVRKIGESCTESVFIIDSLRCVTRSRANSSSTEKGFVR